MMGPEDEPDEVDLTPNEIAEDEAAEIEEVGEPGGGNLA